MSVVPGGKRPEPGIDAEEKIPVEWDDPRYDYLGDAYSMQVNPGYWKFCGWVDDRVEYWKTVNGVSETIPRKGTRMGKMPDAGKEAPTGLYERLEDPVIASKHSAEIEQLILTWV